MLHWIPLTNSEQLSEIVDTSHRTPCLIFKHSTRCSISSMAKFRLEQHWDIEPAAMRTYFLDLIQYRQISNQIADQFNVYHESPQVLLIRDGDCVYDESHMGIRLDELKAALAG